MHRKLAEFTRALTSLDLKTVQDMLEAEVTELVRTVTIKGAAIGVTRRTLVFNDDQKYRLFGALLPQPGRAALVWDTSKAVR